MLKSVDNPTDGPVQKHVSATYYTLRWGVAVIAVVFPFLLWFGGSLFYELKLQDSMSAYYHASNGAGTGDMRDWFVGILFALAGLMYLYKGFNQLENILLNVAGVLAIGVAIFPMDWPSGSGDGSFSAHGACAIGAFVCMALVACLSPGRSLKLMPEGKTRTNYVRAYFTFGVLMVIFPAIAWLLTTSIGQSGRLVFAAEALGLVVFTGFWVTKSLEMRQTQAELKAIQGKIADE